MWRLRAVIMSHAVVHVAGGVRCDMHPPDPPGPSHPGHGFSVQPCNMNVSEQLWVLSPGTGCLRQVVLPRVEYRLCARLLNSCSSGGWRTAGVQMLVTSVSHNHNHTIIKFIFVSLRTAGVVPGDSVQTNVKMASANGGYVVGTGAAREYFMWRILYADVR